MNPTLLRCVLGLLCGVLMTLMLPIASAETAGSIKITFNGVDYQHRWSQKGQNEFTPADQPDLDRWQDMITLNVHDGVENSEQLADLANQVLARYAQRGKILRRVSKPKTAEHPAEYLVVALMGNSQLLEVAFTRFVLVDGHGMALVYSHRAYGQPAQASMREWLGQNGAQYESLWLDWAPLPSAAQLQSLPQSR